MDKKIFRCQYLYRNIIVYNSRKNQKVITQEKYKMTTLTKKQKRKNKAVANAIIDEYGITLKLIENRSGKIRSNGINYHRNTVWAAFNVDHPYYNNALIELAREIAHEAKLSSR